MQANEFVKKFGWDVAVKLSNEMTGITQDVADCVACWGQSEWDYLKRLVDSHELIESYGGLENSKEHTLVLALIEDFEGLKNLRQAIADVESCMGVSSESN